ncbi:MAG: PHP domain-containing protein [Lachnospiraceae bacterium]|nr:PHP domain-containing protein [Lachnospiraceae bacterium]
MAKTYLLPKEGTFYKANLHSHTTVSDGNFTPEEAKEKYRAAGYSILAFTDHRVIEEHGELNDPDFLTLIGYEMDITGWDGNVLKTHHMNAIVREPGNYRFVPNPEGYSTEIIQNTIDELNDSGFLVIHNHPDWSSQEPSDYLPLNGFFAMEAYNNISHVHNGDGFSIAAYDTALRHGKKLYCLATDDNHDEPNTFGEHGGTDSFGGFTMIKAEKLTYGAVIEALLSGSFYSSMGPKIYNYYIEDGRLCVDCDPVSCIYLKSVRPGSSAACFAFSDSLTHAEFDLSSLPCNKDGSTYARIDIVTHDGKFAFTNPIFLVRDSEEDW